MVLLIGVHGLVRILWRVVRIPTVRVSGIVRSLRPVVVDSRRGSWGGSSRRSRGGGGGGSRRPEGRVFGYDAPVSSGVPCP